MLPNSVSNEFNILVRSADLSTRRHFGLKYLSGSSSFTISRSGGFSDFTMNVVVENSSKVNIQLNDCVEVYSNTELLYRGYITEIRTQLDDASKITFIGFGLSQLVRQQYINKNYAFGTAGIDVADAFARIANDYLVGLIVYGINICTYVTWTPVGSLVSSITGENTTTSTIIDSLQQQSANLMHWEIAVDALGNNYLNIGPFGSSTNPDHTIFIPSPGIETSSGEHKIDEVVNQLIITGGTPIYPNLLYNPDFEKPINPNGLTIEGGFLTANGSFETGGFHAADDWTLSSGATVESGKNSPPQVVHSYDGNRYLELDHNGEYGYQNVVSGFIVGNSYNFTFRACKEIGLQTVDGFASITWFDYTSSAISSGSIRLDELPAQSWGLYQISMICPVGAVSCQLYFEATTITPYVISVPSNPGNLYVHPGTYQGGICIDDVKLYDSSLLYQDGWETLIIGSGASLNSYNWVYQNDVYHGNYAIMIDATAGAIGHDFKVIPSKSKRISVSSGQEVRFSCWIKSIKTPSGGSPVPIPQFFLEIIGYKSDGSEIFPTISGSFENPGYLADWTYYELIGIMGTDYTNIAPNITWRSSSGPMLIDAMMLSDAQAPATRPYIQDGPAVWFIQTDDTILNYTWRPGHSLSSPAPYVNSITQFGKRCQTFSDSNIITDDEMYYVADSLFTASALDKYRPAISLIAPNEVYKIGETIRLLGSLGILISNNAKPIVRMQISYDNGIWKLSPELEEEKPDTYLAIQKVIQLELKRQGITAGGNSNGGASSSSGSVGGGTGGSTTDTKVSLQGWDPAGYLDDKVEFTDGLSNTLLTGAKREVKLPAVIAPGTIGDSSHYGILVVDAYGRVVGFTLQSVPVIETIVNSEIPTGTINGSNTVFTLANTPISGSQQVYRDGIRMDPSTDYTIATNTITFTTAPLTAMTLLVDYRY